MDVGNNDVALLIIGAFLGAILAIVVLKGFNGKEGGVQYVYDAQGRITQIIPLPTLSK